MTDAEDSALLLEYFCAKYIDDHPEVADLAGGFDHAVGVVWELLTAGHLQLVHQPGGEYRLEPRAPARPPQERLHRPAPLARLVLHRKIGLAP